MSYKKSLSSLESKNFKNSTKCLLMGARCSAEKDCIGVGFYCAVIIYGLESEFLSESVRGSHPQATQRKENQFRGLYCGVQAAQQKQSLGLRVQARELFAQISRTRDSPHTRDSSQSTQSRDSVSMESFRALFLKAAKLPLEELPSDVPPKRVHAHSLTLPNHPADSFCSQAQESSHYYAAVGFNKLLHFVSVAGTKPEKLFDDCDCDRSGFVDKNEFNKLLFATDLL